MKSKLLFIFLVLFLSFPLANAQAWLNPWLYRKEITIYNSGSTLTNYPIYVSNPVYYESGLVGSWHFDEDSGNTAADHSIYGNIGTLTNGPTWVDGKNKKALSFSSTSNQSVNFPDNDILDPLKITIVSWVKISSAPTSSGNIVSKGANSGYRFRINNDRTVSWFDRGTTNSITTTGIVPINQWTHIAVVGDSNGLKIYINGNLNASNSVAYGGPNTADSLKIGGEPAFNEYFNGIIDEVRIYNRNLTENEIKDLYEAKAKLNYDDIRFTDSDGTTQFYYWFVSDGKFYVNVTSIPSGNKTIYVYYGNPSANSTSNGDLTFDFFDDFSTKDTSKWDWPTNWINEMGAAKQTNATSWSTSMGSKDLSIPLTSSLGVFVITGIINEGTAWAYDIEYTTKIAGSWYSIPTFTEASDHYYFFNRSCEGSGTCPSNSTRRSRIYGTEIFTNSQKWYLDNLQMDSRTDSLGNTINYFAINTKGIGRFDYFIVGKYASPDPTVFVETALSSGNTTFSVKSISLSPIELKGDPDYLNVYWNGSYILGGTGNVRVNCYLNCNPETTDCSSIPATRQCSYTGSLGSGGCTILATLYDYYNDNSLTCKFIDLPSGIPYAPPYPNKTFRPVNFTSWFSGVSALVGTPFNLQINVKNTGLFDDRYNASVSTDKPNILFISPTTKEVYIGPLKGDSKDSTPETGFNYTQLTVFTDEPNVCISINSMTKKDIAIIQKCVQVYSKTASLPDFDLLAIIQVILLVGILALLKF